MLSRQASAQGTETHREARHAHTERHTTHRQASSDRHTSKQAQTQQAHNKGLTGQTECVIIDTQRTQRGATRQ